jgi:hypothetical protein
VKQQVRFVLSDASTPGSLAETVGRRTAAVVDTPADGIDTTLIVHRTYCRIPGLQQRFPDNADAVVSRH